jgi:hypothetical protein
MTKDYLLLIVQILGLNAVHLDYCMEYGLH